MEFRGREAVAVQVDDEIVGAHSGALLPPEPVVRQLHKVVGQ